jgi:hypothetical protein
VNSANHSNVPHPTSKRVTLEKRGIIVSISRILYQPIQNPMAFANSEDIKANANIPDVPPSLQGCASFCSFCMANSPADIIAAPNAMFDHALVTAPVLN